MRERTRGNTLVELLVVLAILGVVAGVTGLAFRPVSETSPVDAVAAQVATARRDALRTGRPVTVMVSRGGDVVAATAHPDGRVVADTTLAIDPLTGRQNQ